MRNSIPNPTKSFSVNFSHEDVKKAMSNLQIYLGMADAPGYQIDHFDEAIGELRLRKTEFLSLGVVIVINANFVNETTTNISIEVQRVFGTFDQMHEVTLANRHLNLMTQTLSSLLQNPSMDVNHNSFLILKKGNEKGLTIFGLLGWVFFWYIKLPIWIIKHPTMTTKKKVIWVGVVVLLFAIGLYNSVQSTKTDITNQTDVLIKKGSTYTMKISKKRDDGVTDTVTFSIDNVLIDSLKIKESDINQMCRDVVWFADFNVKYKPTYTLPKEAMLYYGESDKDVNAHIKGTAENAYGVRDEMSTMMSFDKEYQIIAERIVSL